MSAAALSARVSFAPAARLLRRRASFSSSIRASRASMPSAPIAATSSPRDFPDEMRAACEAVRLASRLCVATQDILRANERVQKQDDSPVTVADFAAQAVVSHWLHVHHPDIALVAEETADDLRGPEGAELLAKVTALVNSVLVDAPGASALDPDAVADAIDRGAAEPSREGRFWILDPIDGTKGFINGRQYAIALALMEDGDVTGGVLGCPNMQWDPIPRGATEIPTASPGVLFAAHRSVGCVAAPCDARDPLDGDEAVPVTTRATTAGVDACYMESWGDSIVADHGGTARLADALGVASPPVRIDSMAKYGALARGDTDLYLRFPPATYREKVWDHAAGAAVVTAAGGVISDGAGKPLDFAAGRFLDVEKGIVASATPELHAELLAAVAARRP